jgi:CRP-like cAMP-binding protein
VKPLLQNISGGLAELLERRGRERVFAEDEEIFAEGDSADFLPIILSGRIKMVQYPEVGKEVILGIFESGEMFAVPPVFDGKKYPSTAVAMEQTELLVLKREIFLDLIRESDEFAFAIIDWMCAMLREKTATIQNLAVASPEHRVGHVLLKLAAREDGGGPVKIALRRQDIAKMAGLTTETTIRAVRKLAERGLVRIDHGKVMIDATEPLSDYLAS